MDYCIIEEWQRLIGKKSVAKFMQKSVSSLIGIRFKVIFITGCSLSFGPTTCLLLSQLTAGIFRSIRFL